MKTFHFCKATDLYDCGTATFGIAKGNIQSVLTLVFRNPGGRRGNNHNFYGDVPLKDWLIDWMGFNATFSSISAISWIENWPKLIYPKQVYYRRLYTIFGHFFTRKGEKMPQNLYNCFISFWKLPPSLSGSTLLNPVIVFVRKVLTYE